MSQHQFRISFWAGLGLLLLGCSTLAAQDRTDPLARFKRETDAYLKLWREGHYVESLRVLEEAIMGSQEGVPMTWLYNRAELMFQVGRYDDAISEIQWLHLRRPSPASAIQLATYQKERGLLEDYQKTLDASAARYARYTGEKDDAENDLAIIRLRELMGENPRVLFAEFAKIDDPDTEDQVSIHRAAGELALRKYDYQLASTEFQKALDLDPKQVDVMAALAECYWRSSDPRLDPLVEKIEAINVSHPRILAMKIELALDAGRHEEATQLLDRALRINPHSSTFIGLKAASLFLLNDLPAMRQLQLEALGYNPAASAVFRIPGRIASRQYRFAEGSELQNQALGLDYNDLEAHALYGFDLLRLGREAEGRTHLELVFAADRFNVPVYNMLELLDTLATFETVTAKPFLLKMPAKERAVWGDDALDLVREAHSQLSKRYQVQLSDPIHLQIFDNHDDFMVRSVGLPGSIGYLGICFGNLITMDTPSAREKGTFNWQATLWHEFTHVITLQKTHNRMPRWLSEGISVFEETRRDPAWGQRPNPAFAPIVGEGTPNLDSIEAYFTQPKTQAHLIFGYYVAGAFVGHYVQTYGQAALVQALDGMAKGEGALEALTAAAKVDRNALNATFSTFMGDLLKPYANLPSSGGSLLDRVRGGSTPTQELVKSPYPAALEKAAQALEEKRFADAERWLKEANTLFPETVEAESPLHQLAELYELWGKPAERRAILDELFQLDATDWQVCQELAGQLSDEKRWDYLAQVATRGLSIDPFDADARRALVEARLGSGDRKAALKALKTLILVDPDRKIDYQLQRTELLLQSEQWAVAKTEILQVLEASPQSWPAQQLLLHALNQTQP